MISSIGLQRLKDDEGFRAQAYRDTTGHLTIGYGFNVDAGISSFAANALLVGQVAEIEGELATRLFGFWQALNDTRRDVLLNMAFNLGVDGLMEFKRMISALAAGDYRQAAVEIVASKAYSQARERYERLTDAMETGQWSDAVAT